MRPIMRSTVALLLIATACIAGRAWAESAGPNPSGARPITYLPDKCTTAFRAVTSMVDSLTTAGVTSTPKFYTTDNAADAAPHLTHGLRKNIGIAPRFQASADTVTIKLAYCWWDGATETITSWSDDVVLTAGTTQLESSYYAAPEYVFDTHGANVIHVLIISFNPAVGHQVTTWCRSW